MHRTNVKRSYISFTKVVSLYKYLYILSFGDGVPAIRGVYKYTPHNQDSTNN